ncbi:hypothetical protein AB7M18_002534 [Pseudomonas viridiflava]
MSLVKQPASHLRDAISFVGGGLPAMQSTRYFRETASSFIAGKPPPTVRCLLRDSATSKT